MYFLVNYLNFYLFVHKVYKHIFCRGLFSIINVCEIVIYFFVIRMIYDYIRNSDIENTSLSRHLVEMQRLLTTLHL